MPERCKQHKKPAKCPLFDWINEMTSDKRWQAKFSGFASCWKQLLSSKNSRSVRICSVLSRSNRDTTVYYRLIFWPNMVKWCNSGIIKNCYVAAFFPAPAARALISYFEVTWHLTIKLFPAKSLWAGNSAKSMTSEGNSALLPANVDRFFLFVLCNKSLNDWFLGKVNFVSLEPRETKLTVSLGTRH